MHKEMLYNRAAVLVTKYIESYEIRVEVGGGIKIMYDRMRNMQDRMRIQLVYNKSRLDYLHHFFDIQRDIYGLQLKRSKSTSSRTLYQSIDSYDIDLCRKMMSLYIERCKFKHALAFFQYRAWFVPEQAEECEEMFDARASHLKKQVDIASMMSIKEQKRAENIRSFTQASLTVEN